MADRRVAAIAAQQRGLVAYPQLREAGLTPRAIRTRAEAGRLHRVFRGVYAVGHAALPPLGVEQAALLACGSGAVLSHRSAAVVWGLLPPGAGPVDVTRPPPHRRGPQGVRMHRVAEAPPARRRHGLAVTAPARTLVDLCAVAGAEELEAAVNQAQLRRLVDPDELRRARRLREIIEGRPTPTRAESEQCLLALLRRAGLPRPRTNARVAGHEVDALWPEQRLIVEVDGFAYHRTRSAFEHDRLRDADLTLAGYTVIRVTWRQLTENPEALAARLSAALAIRAHK